MFKLNFEFAALPVFLAALLLIRLPFITLFWKSVMSYIWIEKSNQCQPNVPNSRSVPHANAMGKKRWQVLLSKTMTTGTGMLEISREIQQVINHLESTSCFAAKMAPPDSYDPSASVDMPHPKWHKDAVAKYLDSCPNICSSPAPGKKTSERSLVLDRYMEQLYLGDHGFFCLPGTNIFTKMEPMQIHTTYTWSTVKAQGDFTLRPSPFDREKIYFAVFFRAIYRHLL